MELSKSLDNIINCPVCTTKENTPKLLSCGHTICVNCAADLLKMCKRARPRNAGVIECPLCRAHVVIPSGGPENLMNNFTVMQVRDALALSRNTSSETPCELCELDIANAELPNVSGAVPIPLATLPCLSITHLYNRYFELDWDKTTPLISDMCFSTNQHIAVLRKDDQVVLYDLNGNKLHDSKTLGVHLRNPRDIVDFFGEAALLVLEHGVGDIVMLSSEDLHFIKKIQLEDDIRPLRLKVLGLDTLVVIYKKDSQVRVGMFDSKGIMLSSWECSPELAHANYLAMDDGNVYMSVKDKLYIYNHQGELQKTITIDHTSQGVVPLPGGEILVVVSVYGMGGRLVSCSSSIPGVRSVVTWRQWDFERFGFMLRAAVHHNKLVIAGSRGMCFYSIE